MEISFTCNEIVIDLRDSLLVYFTSHPVERFDIMSAASDELLTIIFLLYEHFVSKLYYLNVHLTASRISALLRMMRQ